MLDGWHRYRAALSLNRVHELAFTPWEETEGDPVAFVSARNIERRHLSASQRAQIVVEINGWLEKGRVDIQKDGVSNDTPQPNALEHAEIANF